MKKKLEQTETTSKATHTRSPMYPFISLRRALERAREFYKVQHQHPTPVAAAVGIWEFKEKSSGGLQTISALKQFGLMSESEEETDARKVQLTESALAILRDEREPSPEPDTENKDAALLPKIYSGMWHKWGNKLPNDATIKLFLTHEKKYNETAVPALIAGYKDTLTFANLTESDKSTPAESESEKQDGGPPPPAPPPLPGAKPMEGERIVFTQEIEPTHSVRVVASGDVDGAVLAALNTYVQQQRNRFFMVNLEKLLNAGFLEIPSREMWYSRERRMAFSHQAIREMDPRWLERHLAEKVDEGGSDDFVFHFVSPPKDIQNCNEILKEIGLSKLHANIRLAHFVGG